MVEPLLMVRRVFGSIPYGVPMELYFVEASTPRLVQQRSICGMVHIKDALLLIGKSSGIHILLSEWRRHIAVK